MDHPLLAPDRQRARTHAALVILLHPHGAEAVALGLARTWSSAVPAALLSTLRASGGDQAEEALAGIASRVEQAGLASSRLVLAGIGAAQDTALRLVFGQAAVGCAGMLAFGDSLPSWAVLEGHPAQMRAKLRLAWTAEDPMSCAAALGRLLRCFRMAGPDAQGTLLAQSDRPAREAGNSAGLSPPLVRLGGAYLAELVAVALNVAP